MQDKLKIEINVKGVKYIIAKVIRTQTELQKVRRLIQRTGV